MHLCTRKPEKLCGQNQYLCLFVCFGALGVLFCFETRFLCVALAALEIALWRFDLVGFGVLFFLYFIELLKQCVNKVFTEHNYEIIELQIPKWMDLGDDLSPFSAYSVERTCHDKTTRVQNASFVISSCNCNHGHFCFSNLQLFSWVKWEQQTVPVS